MSEPWDDLDPALRTPSICRGLRPPPDAIDHLQEAVGWVCEAVMGRFGPKPPLDRACGDAEVAAAAPPMVESRDLLD